VSDPTGSGSNPYAYKGPPSANIFQRALRGLGGFVTGLVVLAVAGAFFAGIGYYAYRTWWQPAQADASNARACDGVHRFSDDVKAGGFGQANADLASLRTTAAHAASPNIRIAVGVLANVGPHASSASQLSDYVETAASVCSQSGHSIRLP